MYTKLKLKKLTLPFPDVLNENFIVSISYNITFQCVCNSFEYESGLELACKCILLGKHSINDKYPRSKYLIILEIPR